MLIGPETTLEQVDREIARVNAQAKRLPPASDEYVRKHSELNRLCRVRDSYARRDAVLERPESATQRNLTADPDEPFNATRRSRFSSDG